MSRAYLRYAASKVKPGQFAIDTLVMLSSLWLAKDAMLTVQLEHLDRVCRICSLAIGIQSLAFVARRAARLISSPQSFLFLPSGLPCAPL